MVKFLITGHTGMLGSALMRQGKRMNFDIVGLGHDDMDIRYIDDVKRMAAGFGERTVINAAGVTRGKDATHMLATNTMGPQVLAQVFPRVIQISTDCVFDGNNPEGYLETDTPRPEDHYGVTKAGGELFSYPHLTIRGSFIGFGLGGFLDRMILSQPEGAEITGFANWRWNGLYVEDFARIVLELAYLPMHGIVHVGGGIITKARLLMMLAAVFRPDDLNVRITDAPDSKTMVLHSGAFAREQFEAMVGGSLKWQYTIRRMQDDYSGDPSGAVRGQ